MKDNLISLSIYEVIVLGFHIPMTSFMDDTLFRLADRSFSYNYLQNWAILKGTTITDFMNIEIFL